MPFKTLLSRAPVPAKPMYEKRLQKNVVAGAFAEVARVELQMQKAQPVGIALAKAVGRELLLLTRRAQRANAVR